MHFHLNTELFDITHLLLAYAGMSVHALVQMQKAISQYKDDFSIIKYIKFNVVHWIADLIAIPVIIIILTDDSMRSLWPMNFLTATFTGYTAQSMLHSLFKLKKKQ